MNGKVEFTLKPVTGSAGTNGGFRAEVATGKGDVVGAERYRSGKTGSLFSHSPRRSPLRNAELSIIISAT